MKNVLLLCEGLRSPAFFRLQLLGYIVYKDTSSSLKKLSNFGYQKTNQMANRTLNFEAGNGTDEDHAAMREIF